MPSSAVCLSELRKLILVIVQLVAVHLGFEGVEGALTLLSILKEQVVFMLLLALLKLTIVELPALACLRLRRDVDKLKLAELTLLLLLGRRPHWSCLLGCILLLIIGNLAKGVEVSALIVDPVVIVARGWIPQIRWLTLCIPTGLFCYVDEVVLPTCIGRCAASRLVLCVRKL